MQKSKTSSECKLWVKDSPESSIPSAETRGLQVEGEDNPLQNCAPKPMDSKDLHKNRRFVKCNGQ